MISKYASKIKPNNLNCTVHLEHLKRVETLFRRAGVAVLDGVVLSKALLGVVDRLDFTIRFGGTLLSVTFVLAMPTPDSSILFSQLSSASLM